VPSHWTHCLWAPREWSCRSTRHGGIHVFPWFDGGPSRARSVASGLRVKPGPAFGNCSWRWGTCGPRLGPVHLGELLKESCSVAHAIARAGGQLSAPTVMTTRLEAPLAPPEAARRRP